MYDYRKMSEKERQEVLQHHRLRGYPLHAPPHDDSSEGFHLVSAACFEHRSIMASPERRSFFQERLLSFLVGIPDAEIRAWVILPNHYHVLIGARVALLKRVLNRLHSGTATGWNREDNARGRNVWFRFSERRIRDARHFYATVNYIHGNPVKHGWTRNSSDWPWSSLGDWMEELGRDYLVNMWRDYPVDEYGKGWDD